MDKYRIDSHKLIYHVPLVNEWLNGKTIYPVYMGISPSGFCNHRCTFCALDFMKYQKRYLKTSILKERLSELRNLGLKSIMYAGEGEPLLHKDIIDIINHTKKVGIDIAITTNGLQLTESFAESTLSKISWIKVSINAGTSNTYAKIHRTKPDDFDKVIKNMSYAAEIKQENGYKCTLGMQLLLLPENQHETVLLAEIARDIGMDYLVVKPYSQHQFSKTDRYSNIKYSDYMHLADKLSSVTTKEFNVIFRINTMSK
jgi:GTP 3',8-cyclase